MFNNSKKVKRNFKTCSGRLRSIFSYSSVVTVDVDNFGIGLIYRFVQFIILAYIIGYLSIYCNFQQYSFIIQVSYKRYELLYKKGYQSFEVATGTVTSKVKGFGILPNPNSFNTNESFITPKDGILPPNVYKILDTADYIIPPNEFKSIFVMTNHIQTVQTAGVCEEDYTKTNAICQKDSDCKNANANNWNG